MQVIEDRSKAETRATQTVLIQRGYNLVDVGVSRLVLTKYIPEHLMTSYVRAAMKRVATPKQLEDGTWFAEIPELTGIWANGEDLKQCLDELEEVLIDWLLLKIEHEPCPLQSSGRIWSDNSVRSVGVDLSTEPNTPSR